MKRLIILTSIFSVLAMMLVSCASQPATIASQPATTETTTRQATINTAPTPQSPQFTAQTIGGAY